MRLGVTLVAVLLALVACSSGGGTQTTGRPGDDDTSPEDDDTGGDDDDNTPELPPITPACGDVLTESGRLAADLDCSDWTAGAAVLTLGADNVTLDCDQHQVLGPGGGQVDLIKAEGFDRLTVRDCVLRGGFSGVNIVSGADITITGNDLGGVRLIGVAVHELDGFQIAGNTLANDGAYQNGIDVYSSTNGEIAGNTVTDFAMGGIQFLGSNNCEAHDNVIARIADTGFGFFYDPETDQVTHTIEVYDNEVSACGTVGGAEVEHGSYGITLRGNFFHDSAAGVNVYGTERIDGLVIQDNRIEDNVVGIGMTGEAGTVRIAGNTFARNDVTILAENVEALAVDENTIDLDTPPDSATGTALTVKNCGAVSFVHNIVGLAADYYGQSGAVTSVDLSENYWATCPSSSHFSVPFAEALVLINPVNLLPCYYVNEPTVLVDANGDGVEDTGCTVPPNLECVDRRRD
jgi:parallel beta-helix repeat protein